MGVPSRLGRYVVRRRLGSGGFATVWLAHDEQLDAEVAVKVLADNWAHDDSVRRRFLEEGRFLRRVESEHVVQVHDVGELEDGRPFLVLTYADRGTLADRLKKEPLPLEPAIGVIVQVGRGLQALHRRGLLHRDVKPANVLFRSTDDDGERAVLSDLGLGKSLDEVSRITMPGGTPSYVAPEQAMGERLDQRADQYSLGAVAYAALTGRSPHQVDGLGAAGRVKAAPPPSSLGFTVPERVDAAIVRALDPDREKRWPDIESFTRELVGGLDETTQNFIASAGTPVATFATIASSTPVSATDETEVGEKTALSDSNAPTVIKTGTTTVAADATPLADRETTDPTTAVGTTTTPAGTATSAAAAGTAPSGAPASAAPAGSAGTTTTTPGAAAATTGAAAGIATAGAAGTATPGAPAGAATSGAPAGVAGTADAPPASSGAASTAAATGAATDSSAPAGSASPPRRRRGRWVLAAILALLLGGGAGFGVQRYLETTSGFAKITEEHFSVKTPRNWMGVVSASTWHPPGSQQERRALLVSKDTTWNTPDNNTPGVFIGQLATPFSPSKVLVDPKKYGCTTVGNPTTTTEGTTTYLDQISENCGNGTTLLQRVVSTGNDNSLLIQVQVPGSERDKAVEVAASVTFTS
ncbi:serine/threonine-protein kinase [Kribbella sp. NPDC051718]|uniref:serine/threonine-protein kinase n=1 Tax=Kribbella sp. NPDC051718 TaxID=3155168 RepID=UPI003414DCA5